MLSGGTYFIYTQPLTALTVASVTSAAVEDRLQFTLSAGVTGQPVLPASCGFLPVDFEFEGGKSYLMAVLGGNIIAGEYTPGSATV